MITYVFPGQGSQQKGMGQGLFEQYQHLTDQADQILGYSIEKLCTEKSYLDVNHTEYTQPALYVVNALSYLKRVEETGRKPDFAAGHSLGEYNALMAAGAFDFETGLRLVKKRGELMGRITGGGMAAVIGLSKEQVTAVLEEHRLYDIDVANENTPQQIVISGPKKEIEKARAVFENTKDVKLFHPLNVSGAFHSRYMNEAKQVFKQYIDSFQFAPLAIPVISNVYAEPYHQDRLKDTLSEQMDNTVKWTDSIRFLMGRGEMEFAEIGPGTVLTGLIHRIKNEAEPLTYIPKKNPAISAHLKEQRNVQAGITAESLGSAEFKQDYHLTYAYLAGGMYRGIASKEMVVKLSRAGMMGFFGTGGLSLKEVEDAIHAIQGELGKGQAYGINLVHNMKHTESEEKMIDLLLRNQVSIVEASAFLSVTPVLVRYRAKGVKRNQNGDVICSNRLIAKISRPEVAESFLSPAPENMLQKLAFFEANQFLDAYNAVVHALHHLARIEVIDRGFHPETTVWSQVRQMEPQVYKLYSELIESHESLEKRLELLFLANDFLIHSKAEIGSAHLFEVMKEKDIWQFGELLQHHDLKHFTQDLGVMLDYLTEKGLINVCQIETKGQAVYHRGYSFKKGVDSDS